MSRISSKLHETLPASVLRDAGLAAGDQVIICATGHGRIELERAKDVITRFAGGLPAGAYPTGHLDDLRHEWRA